jgi:transcriptional regulator with XRE-family HTH domain
MLDICTLFGAILLWKSGGAVDKGYAQLVNTRFGERLAVLRRIRRVSQAELGRRIGFSRATIANLEGGDQNVQLHQIYAIARALDAPVDDLLPQAYELPDMYAPAENPDLLFLRSARRQLINASGDTNENS